MIATSDFLKDFNALFPGYASLAPWELTGLAEKIISGQITTLDDSYIIHGNTAVHRTATIEEGAILKAPYIISANCFVAAHAYLRNGVFVGAGTSIGPSAEIKASFIMQNSVIAHINFIGDSIIGSNVNFEAGALTANHYNERPDKRISVLHKGVIYVTGKDKFGSVVGDNCKIGANAVLSPGTLLLPGTTVNRLELIDQLNNN